MNLYEKAILTGETTKFLLGKDEYFYLERDWGEHDSSRTACDMLEYAQIHGEQALYNHLNQDLARALAVVSIEELLTITSYIRIYYLRREEGKYQSDWQIGDDIKRLVKYHTERYDLIMSSQLQMVKELATKLEFSLSRELD